MTTRREDIERRRDIVEKMRKDLPPVGLCDFYHTWRTQRILKRTEAARIIGMDVWLLNKYESGDYNVFNDEDLFKIQYFTTMDKKTAKAFSRFLNNRQLQDRDFEDQLSVIGRMVK